MAMTITVDSVDITAYVDVGSIVIETVADSMIATCRFRAWDHSGTIDIEEKDAITIVDGATTLFAGEVADVDEGQHGLTKDWSVVCQDNNVLLDEGVVTSESYDAGETDSDIVADLVHGHEGIDATTHVSTLDASMEAVTFTAMTLRECLDDLARRTGARYYVDADKYLHWFSTESNAAAWNLSTSPNGVTLFGYGGFRRQGRASKLANRVYVQGKEVAGWVVDAASVATYGDREAVSRDQRITTAQGVTDRGDAILGRYDQPRSTYELYVEREGLTAGMSIEVTNEIWGISALTLYIRKIKMVCVDKTGDRRRYYLTLGDWFADMARAKRQSMLQWATVETELTTVVDTVFDTDAPAAPNALGAGNVTTGVDLDADGHQIVYFTLTWSAVGDADLDHYEVQIATAADFSARLATRIHPAGGDREERFDGVLGNTTYYVRVRAVDWVGNQSAWDYGGGTPYSFTTARDTAAPAQVTGLSAGGSRTLIGLSWTANSEADLKHYEIQRAPDVTGSPGTWATIALARLNYYIDQDFTDPEISANDTFWYRVRAVDTSDNSGTWATQTSAELDQVGSDHIAANAITANHIAANTITAAEIAAGAIDTDELAADAVTADKIDVTQLSAIAADMGTLTAGEIRVGTGTVGVDFTGFRIYASYIGGFNDDDFQAGIRTSDGALVGVGGDFTVTEDGVFIVIQTSFMNDHAYGFTLSGSYVGGVDARNGSGSNEIRVYSTAPAGDDGLVGLSSAAPSGQLASSYVSAIADDEYVVLELVADDAAPENYARFYGGGSSGTKVFIEDDANAEMTIGLTINQGANDDEALALKSSDVAHGMTDDAETDTYGYLRKVEGSSGGLALVGLKDPDGVAGFAVYISGKLGEAADTAKTTSAVGVVTLGGAVKSGTGSTAIGADGNIVCIRNYGTTRFIFDAEGSAHADVEWVAFDDYDDLALVTDLERAMLAQQDPVKAGFVEFLRYNHAALEDAGIVHFDRENPGHAMLNTTKLSMLLVGTLRQLGARVERVERALAG
jgi:hypothetical protein